MTDDLIISQAQDWQEEYGNAGKNFLDVYNDGVKNEYYKHLGYSSMEDCTQAVSVQYGWSKSVAATMAVEVLPQLEAEAKERQGQRTDLFKSEKATLAIDALPDINPKMDESKQPQSLDKAGQMFGVGRQYVSDAKKLQSDAPELFEEVKAGEISIPEAKEEIKYKARRRKKELEFYTLPDWDNLPEPLQAIALNPQKSNDKFNQTNDNIEWARWSWNPVTGCLHGCGYCYARDIAKRFYDYLPFENRFKPVFYPDRLLAPKNTKQPDFSQIDDPIKRDGLKNVFVCSMADLFGKWIPNTWIKATIKQVVNNPQWNFIFLTKFPQRYPDFEFPNNAWVGTTVDTQARVKDAESIFKDVKAGIKFLSCEPMLERLTFDNLDVFNWVIMGGASSSQANDGTKATKTYKPLFDDIVHLYLQARQAKCKVYMKTNLGIDQRIREYPQCNYPMS